MAEEGWSPVILDGQLFPTDRLVETTTSVKGEPIDTWYCGKHRDFGADIQAITRPDGLPLWTCDGLPGRLHDWTRAQPHDIPRALSWAASHLHLPTLADIGYDGAGQGVHTTVKQPVGGARLAADNRAYNTCCAACAHPANAASPSSPVAGAPYAIPPQARAASAITSAPASYSPISNTGICRILVDITWFNLCSHREVTGSD